MSAAANMSGGGFQSREHKEERRKKHLRRSSVAILILLPLFAVFGSVWILVRFVMCLGIGYEIYTGLCENSYAAPLLFSALIALTFLWMGLVVFWHGLQDHIEPPGQIAVKLTTLLLSNAVIHSPRHIGRGYGLLDTSHQKHVRRSVLFFSVVVGAYLAFWVFWEEYPPLLSLFLFVAVPIAAGLWMRKLGQIRD